MSSFRIFDIAGSGMSAQSVRLNTVASNLANAESVSGDANTVYRAKHPVFEAVRAQVAGDAGDQGSAVRVSGIVEDTRAPEKRFDRDNPLANADGYVFTPECECGRGDGRHDQRLACLTRTMWRS